LYDVNSPQFLDIRLKGGGEVVSSNALTMLSVTRRITVTHYCQWLIQPHTIHNAQPKGLGKLKKSNYLIGIQTKYNTESLYISVITILLQLPCENYH
jgi:hypothetical protein